MNVSVWFKPDPRYLCLNFQCFFPLPVENEWTQLTVSAKAEDAAPLLQQPSPDPRYRPALKKERKKFFLKNGGEESAHPSWVDNQPANQLLAHWLCHQAWILRKDPPLCCWCCCCLGSSLCICISVCLRCVCVRVCGSRMKWNARIGLPPGRTSPSYNVRQPAGTVGSGRSRIHQGTGPGGPGVIQREGRIFFFFFFK